VPTANVGCILRRFLLSIYSACARRTTVRRGRCTRATWGRLGVVCLQSLVRADCGPPGTAWAGRIVTLLKALEFLQSVVNAGYLPPILHQMAEGLNRYLIYERLSIFGITSNYLPGCLPPIGSRPLRAPAPMRKQRSAQADRWPNAQSGRLQSAWVGSYYHRQEKDFRQPGPRLSQSRPPVQGWRLTL